MILFQGWPDQAIVWAVMKIISSADLSLSPGDSTGVAESFGHPWWEVSLDAQRGQGLQSAFVTWGLQSLALNIQHFHSSQFQKITV